MNNNIQQLGIQQLDHLNLTVASFDETVAWYSRVLGFRLVERGVEAGRPWGVIRAGDAMLCIYERPDLQAPAADAFHRVSHFALRITDVQAWRATVEQEQLELGHNSPVEWPASTAWYITDPNGYEIEIAAWRDNTIRFAEAV
jgi:catechol 2,3-dioxygenase-like lactoylglutathione lyase family enzyme